MEEQKKQSDQPAKTGEIKPKDEKPKVDKKFLETKIADKEKLLSDKQIINK